MSRGLMNWTFLDVQSFLKNQGFQLHHTRGSHYYYRRFHADRVYLTHVQYHGSKSIPPDTMRAIIKQSGIPKEKWTGDE